MYVFTMRIAFVYCILQWNLLEQGPWNGAPRTIFWRFAVFSCIGTATLYKLAMWDNFIPVPFIYRHMACLTSFRSPLPRSDVCPQAGIYLSFFLWSGMACFKRRHVPPIVPVSTCKYPWWRRMVWTNSFCLCEQHACNNSCFSHSLGKFFSPPPGPNPTSCVASTMLATSRNVNITPPPIDHFDVVLQPAQDTAPPPKAANQHRRNP